MKRITIFLTFVLALSAVACSGESGEAYGEVQQAAITPTLRVRSISASGPAEGASLKLSVVVVPDLYLGTITLVKGAPSAPTTGRFVKGTTKRPGSAEATIGAELWDRILADSELFTLSIELRYNANAGTFNEIFIGSV
mgnify:CR=1 FL=1